MPRAANLVLTAVLLVAVALIAFSDSFSPPTFMPAQDKAEHVLAFSMLALALMTGANAAGVALAASALTAFAFAIEWAQPLWTATREGDLADALASFAGIGVGALLAGLLNLLVLAVFRKDAGLRGPQAA
ncbi:MAG: hypothetical protein JNJ63_11155 [Hyphomonadaceae bacterium]|nr:hypothetical protein [Hyphomonadaceae bacterium]